MKKLKKIQIYLLVSSGTVDTRENNGIENTVKNEQKKTHDFLFSKKIVGLKPLVFYSCDVTTGINLVPSAYF